MKKGKSVLWTWTVSYIIVMLIPIITVCINYRLNVETVKQGVIDNYQMKLDNLADNIDMYLEMQREFYAYAFTTEEFVRLQRSDQIDVSFYNRVKNLHDRLIEYKTGINYEMHCMIYVKNKEYIVSEIMANTADSCYKTMKRTFPDFMEYDAWNAMLTKQYTNEFFVAPQLIINDEPTLFFANTLKSSFYGGTTIFLTIPLFEIEKMTKEFPAEIYLCFNIDDAPAAVFHAGQTTVLTDMEEVEKKWLGITKKSYEEGISYTFYVTQDYLENALAYTKKTFILNLSVCILFCITGCLFLLFRNYKPLWDLVKYVGSDSKSSNEYMKIDKAYKKLEKDKLSLQKLLRNQQEEIMGNRLLSLLKGRNVPLQMEEQGLSLLPDIKGDVALVGFRFSDLTYNSNTENNELIFFVIDNMFKELMEQYKLYRIEDGWNIFYLIELPEVVENEWIALAKDKVTYLCNMVSDRMGFELNAVVSSVEKSLVNIHLLYLKVMEGFDYQNLAGDGRVISTLDLEEQDNVWLEFVQSELSEALHRGDLELAVTKMEQFLDKCVKLQFSVVKIYAFELYNTMIGIYKEYEKDPSYEVTILYDVELLIQANDIESMKELFRKTLANVCDRISKVLQQTGRELTEQIKEYVNIHYMEQQLDIGVIAEHLARTPKHISVVFRHKTGEGIWDYINKVRILKARELLLENKYKVEEIALQVGYPDARSFRKIFKKIMGMPPSKYIKP